MSLGRLLAAGKSLIGLGGPGRYREDKHVRLPKFVSPKNPFAAETDAAQVEVAVEGASIEETAKPVAKEEKPVAVPSTAGPVKSVGWMGALGAKLNPLGRKSSSPGPVRSLRPQQGELSLDMVQVVRNDLRDSDFEVAKASVVKPVSPVMAMTAEKLEPVGAAWNRLATRFLGEDQP